MKEILSAFAIVLTVASFVPYIRSIRAGQTRPHVFSWIIWGVTTCIVFFAQLADAGGAGAWPTGLSGAITFYVAWLIFRKNPHDKITRSDWGFFILALSSLPLWYFTSNPLWAVVILTTVDLLGFAPTFRKAYAAPREEQITFYALLIVRNILSIGALENFSVTTILFPAAISAACVAFIAMIAARRRPAVGRS